MAAVLVAGCGGPGGSDEGNAPVEGNESAVADEDRTENESGESEYFDDRNQTGAEGDEIDGDEHEVPEGEGNETNDSPADEPPVSADDNESGGNDSGGNASDG